MFQRHLQLVCSVLAFSLGLSAQGQSASTGTVNGIVSAAGSPIPSQTIAYSIEGQGLITSSSKQSAPTVASEPSSSTSASDNISMDGSVLSEADEHGLPVPAIIGIAVAIMSALIGIGIITAITYKKRRLAIGRAKRKSIMDLEFAETDPYLTGNLNSEKSRVGYFDVAKPLPAVISDERYSESETLSRSSTLIADAAEIAQINRKASVHQIRQKESREQLRERNHALQILITNTENRTSVLSSPLASNPSTPVDIESSLPTDRCPDGDGDAFAKHPSKL